MGGDIMDIIRAKEIVRSLVNGVDPMTGEVFPEANVFNSPEVIRALYTLLEAVPSQKTQSKANAGKPWTKDEDDRLRDEFSSGLKCSQIAKVHERTTGAIESRLKYLELR